MIIFKTSMFILAEVLYIDGWNLIGFGMEVHNDIWISNRGKMKYNEYDNDNSSYAAHTQNYTVV